MSGSADNVSANLELIRSATEALNTHDLNACLQYITPDFIIHLAELPEPLYGRETWRQNAEVMQQAFPDLTARIDGIVAAGDEVALRLAFTGTHAGEFLGRPATGRTVRYISHEFYRIADGLIAEEWICSDTFSLLQQVS
jgi:steroid delta-isomerase-like uncharacterized protein